MIKLLTSVFLMQPSIVNLVQHFEENSPERGRSVSVIEGAPLRNLRLIDLCFTDFVNKQFLKRRGFTLSSKPPIVASVENHFLVLDGNHRCALELAIRSLGTIECAVWSVAPEIRVKACESTLFDAVIRFGIDRAVKAHRSVTRVRTGLAPGVIVFT